MRTPDKKVISDSLEFAARWGFLTQSLFFEFFCRMSRAQQYRYWSYLTDKGYFVKSKHHEHTLILSYRSRKLLGDQVRPARSYFYIEHDSIVARFYLSLAQRDLLGDAWLEDELMRNPLEAYSVLGCQQIQRVPDLVFDLKRNNAAAIRCALEIEKSTKSKSRYAKIALAYLDMSKVSISLYGCVSETTAKVIRSAFNSPEFVERDRIPGTFFYESYDASQFNSQVRFADNEMTFQNFISVVTGHSLRDRIEKSISVCKPQKSEAA